jgi:hypothetical protein
LTPEIQGHSGRFGRQIQLVGDSQRASALLLLHDADRFYFLFRKTHGFPTGRFDFVSLPGFADVVFRLDLISGLSQVRGGDFGDEHLTGLCVLKYNNLKYNR